MIIRQAPTAGPFRHGGSRDAMPVVAMVGMLVWASVSLFVGLAYAAGDRLRRAVLEVEVRIESGRERWKSGSEWKEGAFSLTYVLNLPYVAAPTLDSINPYDPAYGVAAMRQVAQAEALAVAIDRQGQGDQGPGNPESPFRTVIDPSRMTKVDPERMAELATRSAACRGNRACLLALGLEMMASGANDRDASLVQTTEQISAGCSRDVGLSDGAAFDACMQAGGSQYAMPPEGEAQPDVGPGFAEPAPDRFQRWETAWDADRGCGATMLAEYRYQAAEQLNDVTGPVNGREAVTGAFEGEVIAAEMPLVCSSNQIVTDVTTGRMYIQSFHMPAIPAHHVIDSKLRGGLLEEIAPAGLPGGPDMVRQWTVSQWVSEQLVGAPPDGHNERAFKIKGDMNGISLPTAIAGAEEIVRDETDPTAWKRQAPNFHETEFVVKVTWRLRSLRP